MMSQNGIPSHLVGCSHYMHPHKVIRVLFWLLMFGQCCATAVAQESTDPMEVCYRLSDRDAKLACFDNEMQRRHALLARKPTTPPTAPAATSAPAAPSGASSVN